MRVAKRTHKTMRPVDAVSIACHTVWTYRLAPVFDSRIVWGQGLVMDWVLSRCGWHIVLRLRWSIPLAPAAYSASVADPASVTYLAWVPEVVFAKPCSAAHACRPPQWSICRMLAVSSSFHSLIMLTLSMLDGDVGGFRRVTHLEKVVRLREEAVVRFLGVTCTEIWDCLR